ncbi:DUF3352 domain-containing protein [Candidatus Peregrinibacteria bacterium]|nr:DUF3352 domain-containing protein [Candidatus Peregrinibacteria bacterium]
MGRKSSTKKIVRELTKEKHPKAQSRKINFRLKIQKHQIYGAILVIIMISILISAGYLIFQRAFRSTEIARFLPEKQTVFTVELNYNPEHSQFSKTAKILEKYPYYSAQALKDFLTQKLQTNFETQINPWLGKNLGLSILNSKNTPGETFTVYFLETKDKAQAEKWLRQSASAQPYNNREIFLLQNGARLTLIDEYLFLSEKDQSLKELIDFSNSDEDALFDSSRYLRAKNNLPFNYIAFAFINFKNINDDSLTAFESIKPFLKFFDSEGLALVAMDEKFALQSFLNLSGEEIENMDFLENQEKYQADLAAYVKEDALIFWGGNNLENQLRRLILAMSGGDKDSMQIFDTVLQNYTNRYFGPEITLSLDILPLFKNEFALAIEEYDKKLTYKLLLKINNSEKALEELHDIFDNFAKVGSVYEKKIVTFTMADGTVGKEIMAVPENIRRQKLQIDDYDIFELTIGQKNSNIFYAVIDRYAIVTDNFDTMKNAVNMIKNGGKSLRLSKDFQELITHILSSSDEVSYLNFDKLMPLIFKGGKVPKYLLPLSSLTSGKNYFQDGVTTINYLDIN